MQYRRLGHTGLQLSALSFGAWVTFGTVIGRSEARELLSVAHDHGINFFDNAETYNNGIAEQIMGDVLADIRLPRDSFCVSSKVFFGCRDKPSPTQRGLSRKHVVEACHQALQRLRVDYLDLYFCHRPDPDTPISETVHAMDDLIRQGKVLYWGTSEWTAEQIKCAAKIARERGLYAPVVEQPQYNLIHRDKVELEFAPLYDALGIGLTIWSPLASGVLTGKYVDGIPADSRLAIEGYEWLQKWVIGDQAELRRRQARDFVTLAREVGQSPAVLAIAWCLKNPNVSTVLLGASRRQQLEENLKALDVLEQLDRDLVGRMEAIFKRG